MIWLILVGAFILRTYRIEDFLGFWFDQGRDGLLIWNLIHHGKFFLLGPTTGIEGIFLGPFYYYLIAPFYALGKGNPVYPAVFLAAINCAAIYLIYRLCKQYAGQTAGIFAALFYAFSSQIIVSNRWLSNPTPLPFFALAAIWSLVEIAHGTKNFWWWPILGLSVGLGLQLEAASATFFIPVIILSLVLFSKSIAWSMKKSIFLVSTFVCTLLPQLLFNFRNQNILINSFYKFLIADKSFQSTITNFYSDRLAFYYQTFNGKFILEAQWGWLFIFVVLAMALWIWKKIPHKFVAILLLWWLTPVVVLMFYHGNHGYVWDYYFTGVYPIVSMLAGIVLGVFFVNVKNIFRLLPLIVMVVFLYQNLGASLYTYVLSGPPFITLTSEKAAIDWIYTDAGNLAFNTDEYVPPVIPYAYDYLLLWRGQKFGRLPNTNLVKRLYTLREPDPGHQSLLDAWIARQAGIASITNSKIFDSITVERRERFNVNLQ